MDNKDKLIAKLEEYMEKSKIYERFLLMPLQLRTDEWLVKGCELSNVLNKLKFEIAALKAEIESEKQVRKTVLDHPSDFDTIATNQVTPIGSTTDFVVNLKSITDADIETYANERFRGGPTAYDTGLRDSCIKGAKAMRDNLIPHIE